MSQHNEQLSAAIRGMFDTLKGKIDTLFNRTDTHIARQDNPHQVTKLQVGLDKIPNSVTSARSVNSVNTLLTGKAMFDHVNSNDHDARYYTQTQADAALALKVDIASVVNDLVSTTTDAPLSAAQGKVLKDAVDAINTLINSDDATLNEIQEIVDYIKVNREALENLDIAAVAGLQTALDSKVDKITGKGLSTNDLTNTLLTKLNGIEAGAQVNVATNLSFSRSSSAYTILNSNGTGVSLLAADATNYGLMTPGQVSKLVGIESGAQVNQPTSSSRALDDTNILLTAKGMFDHADSDDHDERYYTQTQSDTQLAGKVDKIAGKGLSTEDYTSAEKTKLAGIEAGAEANVGTNLGVGGSGDARTLTSSTGSNVGLPLASSTTAGLLSRAQFNKLGGIESGAQVNVATNLSLTLTATDATITNSNGTNATLPAATPSLAGVMTSADKVKINGIEAGAQVNVGTNLSLTGSGDTRTLQSSTGSNVPLPVATGTTAGLMGVSDRGKLDNIEAGAQVNAPTTASRGSASTTTVLQAKAMADHTASGDHDGRYYQKGEVDQSVSDSEQRAADYTDTRVAVEVDGVVLYNPAMVLDPATVEAQKGTEESFETVIDDWYRFSHDASGVFPARESETTSWTYNTTTEQIECTINSGTVIGFVSPTRHEDYNFEVVVNSSNADDDEIGIVLAFVEIDGAEYMISAGRNVGGIGPQRFNVVYNYGQADSIDLGSNTNGGIGQVGGWSGFTGGARIRAERVGDIITVKTTPLDSTVYDEAATVVIDLNSLPELSKFKGPQQYGYMCRSQANSTWSTIVKPTAIDEVVDVVNRVRWTFDGATWSSTTIASTEELTQQKRLYFNEYAETLLLSTSNGLRQIPIADVDTGVVLYDGAMTITGDLTCNDVVMTSDPRLKEDIESLGGTLHRYLKLSPVQYRMKDDESEQIHFGFLTTDVKELFPDVVRDRADGYQALSYTSFHALTQKSVVELAELLDVANERIGSLEEDVQELKDTVAKLLKTLDH